MSIRTGASLIAFAVFTCGAHAATVQLSFTISDLKAQVGTYDGTEVHWQDASGVAGPTTFDFTVRFELDNPMVSTSFVDWPVVEHGRSFREAVVSETFYTVNHKDLLGPAATFTTWVSHGWTEPGSSVSFDARVVASESYRWDSTRQVNYSRGLHWDLPAPAESSADFDSDAFLALLRSQIGTTFTSAFSEGSSIVTYDRPLGSDAAVVTAWQGGRRVGNVTLRSVSFVPEPATWMLSGLGLLAAAGVARARVRRG